jgi:phage terminase large subunit
MILKIPTNIVFEHLENSNKFITVEQGGTRSGKTYNEMVWLINFCLDSSKWLKYRIENKPLVSVIRKTLPALKASAYRDFLDIMQRNGLYNHKNLNKSELIYTFENGAILEFFSCDQPQKLKSRKRDIALLVEANELTYEDFIQIVFRTKSKIIMDFNPTEEFWVYDKVLNRDDAELLITNFLNNPFLDKRIVEEIKRLEFVDENLWKIYGKGERGTKTELIYPTFERMDNFDNIEFEEEIFGLDFGFNNPTALIKIGLKDECFYETEMLYRSFLTNGKLIKWLNANLTDKEKGLVFYADSGEPQRIDEISDAGYYIKPSDKAVTPGIDFCKRFKTYCRNGDLNNIKEKKNYSWKKDKNGNIIDEPIKFFDHLQDAGRYAKYTHYKNIFGKNIKVSVENFKTSSEIFVDKDVGQW